MDDFAAGPIIPQYIVIPSRIWKRFLMGTYSWMAASIIYMLLATAAAAYYTAQTDAASKAIIGVSYIIAMMSTYWLSATLRDVYRHRVLCADPQLNERVKRNLGGPSDSIRCTRLVFSIVGVVAAIIIFIISMIQTTSDKITGCVIELQIVTATAILTKTFQDREDAKFLASFDIPQNV
jgi:FtsH-binding integral membrane protein